LEVTDAIYNRKLKLKKKKIGREVYVENKKTKKQLRMKFERG